MEKDFAQKIIKRAELYIHHPYYLGAALASVFRAIPIEDKGRFFCSHLVAESYAAAGLEIMTGVPTEKVHPGHIERSDIFDPVEQAVQVVSMKKSTSPRPDFSIQPYSLIESRKLQVIHSAVSDRLEKEEIRLRIDNPLSQNVFSWLALLQKERGVIANKIDDAIFRAVIDENLNELFDIVAKDISVLSGVIEQDFAELSCETNSDFIMGTVDRYERTLIQLRNDRAIQHENANYLKEEHDKCDGIYRSLFIFYQYYLGLTEITDSVILIIEKTLEKFKQLVQVKCG